MARQAGCIREPAPAVLPGDGGQSKLNECPPRLHREACGTTEERVGRTLKTRDKANKRRATQARSDELGTITLRVRPAPDAQERLRRVFALILAAAMRAEYQAPQRKDADPGEPRDGR